MSETKQPVFNLTIVNAEEDNLYKVLGISDERKPVIVKQLAKITSDYYLGNGKRSELLKKLTEVAENTNELVFIMYSTGLASHKFEAMVKSPLGGLMELLSMLKTEEKS